MDIVIILTTLSNFGNPVLQDFGHSLSLSPPVPGIDTGFQNVCIQSDQGLIPQYQTLQLTLNKLRNLFKIVDNVYDVFVVPGPNIGWCDPTTTTHQSIDNSLHLGLFLPTIFGLPRVISHTTLVHQWVANTTNFRWSGSRPDNPFSFSKELNFMPCLTCWHPCNRNSKLSDHGVEG